MVERTAGCACAQTSLTAQGDPVLYGLCHCNNCQRRTGSAFGMNAYFPDDRVLAPQGEFLCYVVEGEKDQHRYFCARCGTTLYWKSGWLQDWTGVAAGCFRDNPLPEPGLTVANDTRQPWLSLPVDWKTHIEAS